MLTRIAIGLAAIAAACATWAWRPHASAEPVVNAYSVRSDSIYAAILPSGNVMIPMLDAAYRDLEAAMRLHGCPGCHAPQLGNGGHLARLRYASQLLDARRSIEAMLEANLMPPETDEHPAGIADPDARAALLVYVRRFRAIGDAALATW